MSRARSISVAALAVLLGSGCGGSTSTDPSASQTVATGSIHVSCAPVLRFRLGDIEYENRRFDDQVATGELGPIVGEVSVYPPAFDKCETVVLKNGEGSLSPGTKIYEITGIDPAMALTATMGNGVYLKYIGRPVR